MLVGLGLTLTQAKVALLVSSGHTTKSAAEALLVGEETVRTHLKGAFARLGLSRQADLIHLVARIAPFGR
ncbi:LuxR C-terminal-related transcriptional regulator [Aureimonas phyllosphaerae]|uniref:LuxR C-terminal-related transcriptional regulator n=1 Tax=Aureimonas phyllosphaerae TaxID=1166078 RepID=UPI000B8A5F3B